MNSLISINLKIWRQENKNNKGGLVLYKMRDISTDLSLLEVLDKLNEQLVQQDKRPINFDHDCREGICGSCGFLINGQAHGPLTKTTVCQLYMRNFKNGTTLIIEPWRAKAFPLIQDLLVDRSSLDRILQAGGYYAVGTGNAPDGDSLPIKPEQALSAFDTATCIGCGACVASCRNASASLFVAAKLAHLGQLPQGQNDRTIRAKNLKTQMFNESFGSCSSNLECEAVCPKNISADWISWMNNEG